MNQSSQGENSPNINEVGRDVKIDSSRRSIAVESQKIEGSAYTQGNTYHGGTHHHHYLIQAPEIATSDRNAGQNRGDLLPSQSGTPYIERPPVEQKCCKGILSSPALIRIRAPKGMGKTELLNRLFHFAIANNYHAVCWDVGSLNETVLQDIDAVWQQLCRDVTRALPLSDRVAQFWQERTDDCSNTKCSDYFDEYLLPRLDRPLVLMLDNFDTLFPYQPVAREAFKVLRSWYEQSKRKANWKKLRLAIAHSTNIYAYPELQNIHNSPFNVGLGIDLPEFSPEQVRELARGCGLGDEELTPLLDMVGGHPALICQAFEFLRDRPDTSLVEMMLVAATPEGIYRNHLGNLRDCLDRDGTLAEAMKAAIASEEPVKVGAIEAFKLSGLGLTRDRGHAVVPRCRLYRLYFRECW